VVVGDGGCFWNFDDEWDFDVAVVGVYAFAEEAVVSEDVAVVG
jgi:hypothetical protein